MKKSIYSISLSLVLFSGCTDKELIEESNQLLSFTANYDQEYTRSSIAATRLSFEANDAIGLFSSLNNNAILTTTQGGANASFSGQGNLDASYIAFFPYTVGMQMEGSTLTGAVIPETQEGFMPKSGVFGKDVIVSPLALAKSANTNLSFKNLCALLKVVVSTNNVTPQTTTIKVKADQPLAGTFNVNLNNGTLTNVVPQYEITTSYEKLESGGMAFTEPPFVYIYVAPGTYTNFSLQINTQGVNKIKDNVTFEAGKVYSLGVYPSNAIPYLSFNSDKLQTLNITTNRGSCSLTPNIEFSADNGQTWTKSQSLSISFGGATGKVLLRGLMPHGTAVNSDDCYQFEFSNDEPVYCSGDIRTIVDYNNYTSVDCSDVRFTNLFRDCHQLVTAPKLPSMQLQEQCYTDMFMNCTSLVSAPALPAIVLAENCYDSMFRGCTSLTTAPSLPATTLASECYEDMFRGCTSLKTAPELNASNLAERCYSGMFDGCTKLESVPVIAATVLAEGCFEEMFYECTALTAVPALKATTLASRCYSNMFYGCTSLTSAPELPATTLAESCYYSMFSNCTALIKVPKLPATQLESNCYYRMFENCTSLATAPSLPATTLAESCYSGMFSNCTSLTTAPSLPATALAGSCYSGMFSNCTSLTTAPSLPATALAEYCYSGMFSSCTSLTAAPDLFAPALVDGCYSCMFIDCSKLNYIKMMAISIPDQSCYMDWVMNVSSTGTFVKNPSATWNYSNVVPVGWTVQ